MLPSFPEKLNTRTQSLVFCSHPLLDDMLNNIDLIRSSGSIDKARLGNVFGREGGRKIGRGNEVNWDIIASYRDRSREKRLRTCNVRELMALVLWL